MKYIVIKNKLGSLTVETPFIFPDRLVHVMVFDRLKAILPGTDHEVVSAGEVVITVESCHGRSTSIKPNVESRGLVDTNLINLVDYGVGLS